MIEKGNHTEWKKQREEDRGEKRKGEEKKKTNKE